jgi:HSP20 family protein
MFYRTSFGVPRWGSRSPFGDLERMRYQLGSLLDVLSDQPGAGLGAGVFPAVNIFETKDDYLVKAELPGLKQDELNLDIKDKTLTIAGERKIEKESGEVKYHRREREAGQFSRAIVLPGEVDSGNVDARLSEGVLTVRIAKSEKAKPRQIAVN